MCIRDSVLFGGVRTFFGDVAESISEFITKSQWMELDEILCRKSLDFIVIASRRWRERAARGRSPVCGFIARELNQIGMLLCGDHVFTLLRRRIQLGHLARSVPASTCSTGYYQVFPFSSRTGTCVSGHLSG